MTSFISCKITGKSGLSKQCKCVLAGGVYTYVEKAGCCWASGLQVIR